MFDDMLTTQLLMSLPPCPKLALTLQTPYIAACMHAVPGYVIWLSSSSCS